VVEKIVFDAEELDRLGLMGMLREMMIGTVSRSGDPQTYRVY
jgi:hypothetical protein